MGRAAPSNQYDTSDDAITEGRVVAIRSSADSERAPRMASSRISRMWWVATLLLVAMAATFCLSCRFLDQGEWVRVVRAFSEAALVGALADWFAVTALFRRPLGLPIPHTGIIPNNKVRIGKSLGLFVQRNFLTAEVLEGQVVNISGTIARFLRNAANRERIVAKVRALIPQGVQVLHDDDIKVFLNSQVEGLVQKTDLARASAKVLRALTSNQMHEVLLDEVLQQLQEFFRSHRLWFREQLRQASPWFVPEFVDRKIFDAIAAKTEQTFGDALANKQHEFRKRLLESLYNVIIKLESSPDLRAKGEELKRVVLASEGFRAYVASLRDDLLRAIDADVSKRDSLIVQALQRALQNVVDTVADSPRLQHKLNRIIRGMLSTLVGKESTYVADLIAKTIESWDSKTLVAKLEEQVGDDLQYIRVNGTIVGGLVGLALYGASAYLLR